MRQQGLKAKTPKHYKLTTDSKHSFPVAANVLDRRFEVDAPNKVWTADISYVWTFEGWLYLAVVMDLYSRQMVGWAMKDRMKKQLAIDALAMTYWVFQNFANMIDESPILQRDACNFRIARKFFSQLPAIAALR